MARLFADAGHRLYLVGGVVRDLWLDVPMAADADIDLTTDAHPTEIKRLLRNWADALWTQGERFGTIGVKRHERAFEVTTHRAEVYQSDSRKPEVMFGDEVEVDLSRRDFTVNAMAIDVTNAATSPDLILVDPFGGADDLAARVLRTPLAPTTSFSDDPLRVLRAARFANKYNLDPADELVAAATDLRHRLAIVSTERIRDELEKFLAAPAVARGFAFLEETRVLEIVLPVATPDAIVAAQNVGPPWWLRLAAIFAAQDLTPDEAAVQLRTLRCSTATTRQVRKVLAGLPLPTDLSPEAIRRWVMTVQPWESECLTLASGLGAAEDAAEDAAENAAEFEQAWSVLGRQEDLRDDGVPLRGDAIAELLGVDPGPEIGHAVDVLREYRLRHGPFDAEAARSILREWSTDRRSGGGC